LLNRIKANTQLLAELAQVLACFLKLAHATGAIAIEGRLVQQRGQVGKSSDNATTNAIHFYSSN
jgi:hypothetical protein